jgi:hypothetical protein
MVRETGWADLMVHRLWFMGKRYGVQDEGVNDIWNSCWMDALGENVCELLNKESESTVSNHLISF